MNESRIMLVALSVSLISMFTEFESPKELLSLDAWRSTAEIVLSRPEYTYIPLALLWLSISGLIPRRKIVDKDRRMTPVALSPLEFAIAWVIIAGILVGLVEAAAWLSFTLWLI